MAPQSDVDLPKIAVCEPATPLARTLLPGLADSGVILTPRDQIDIGQGPEGVEAILAFAPAAGDLRAFASVNSPGPTIIEVRTAPTVDGWPRTKPKGDGQGARRFTLYLPAFRPVRPGGWAVLRAALTPSFKAAQVTDFLKQRGWLHGDEKVLGTGQATNRVYHFMARLTDIIFALGILIGFWWLLLGIMAAIRFDSPGSAIFAQVRVGRFGRPFVCYKFRTMRTGTPHVATHEVAAVAVTRLGSFLRRSKLDELPQVWNLLKGELSLVGPRPCLPAQVALVEARRRAGVLEVRPGITGLAQIHGVDMSDPAWLATYDARYVAIQSLLVDWRIIVDTARGKGNQDRVRA